jgi:hypothetical protein
MGEIFLKLLSPGIRGGARFDWTRRRGDTEISAEERRIRQNKRERERRAEGWSKQVLGAVVT